MPRFFLITNKNLLFLSLKESVIITYLENVLREVISAHFSSLISVQFHYLDLHFEVMYYLLVY